MNTLSDIRHTTAEIATILKIDRDTAYGLLRFLISAGLVEERGVRRPENGRGRGENVYSFVEGFEKQVSKILSAANLT